MQPTQKPAGLMSDDIRKMKSKPGTYVLVLRSDRRARVQVGRWGVLDRRPGYYLYVGSAFGPGGLMARVSRHCRADKAKRWHIDYLRAGVTLDSVWYSHATVRLECCWAQALAGLNQTQRIKGFGCSDCGCESHLFFSAGVIGSKRFACCVGGAVETLSCEPEG